MTAINGNSSNESRLDRIERILESMVLRQDAISQEQQRLTQQLQRTRDVADSNARSIQAWEALIEQNKVEAEEERSEMKVAIRELIRANQLNTVEHELFRRRFEAIDPPTNEQ